MSNFIDELNTIEKEGETRRKNAKPYPERLADHITDAVKNAARQIADNGGKHKISGYFGGSSDTDVSVYPGTAHPACNFAYDLNKRKTKVQELQEVCKKAEEMLKKEGFSGVDIDLEKTELTDAERTPENLVRCGYPAGGCILLRPFGKPKKYVIHIACKW